MTDDTIENELAIESDQHLTFVLSDEEFAMTM